MRDLPAGFATSLAGAHEAKIRRREPSDVREHGGHVCRCDAVHAAFGTFSAHALNSCLITDFVDRRGLAQVQVANDDPTNAFRYRPRCLTVSEGTHLVFRALPNFGMHPLYGGTVSGGVATIDPASPIGSNTLGNEADRLLVDTGEFPFFCDVHYAQGMAGSIRVVPELFKNGFDAEQTR